MVNQKKKIYFIIGKFNQKIIYELYSIFIIFEFYNAYFNNMINIIFLFLYLIY